MNRFVASLNDGSFINTLADRMEIKENLLFAFYRDELVALVEVTAIISAHLRENG